MCLPISEIDLWHVPGVITLLFADSTFERLNIGRLEYCFRKKKTVSACRHAWESLFELRHFPTQTVE